MAKAYAVGKELHLAVLLIAMLRNSLQARNFSISNARVVMKLPKYGCQLSCERKSGNQLFKFWGCGYSYT